MVYSVLVLEILENRKLIEVLESPGISFRGGGRAFFNIYTGGAKAPPAPTLAPPLKGFGPPSNVPFCLKMSENNAEIAGNQV